MNAVLGLIGMSQCAPSLHPMDSLPSGQPIKIWQLPVRYILCPSYVTTDRMHNLPVIPLLCVSKTSNLNILPSICILSAGVAARDAASTAWLDSGPHTCAFSSLGPALLIFRYVLWSMAFTLCSPVASQRANVPILGWDAFLLGVFIQYFQ